jgi:hypothetical protein
MSIRPLTLSSLALTGALFLTVACGDDGGSASGAGGAGGEPSAGGAGGGSDPNADPPEVTAAIEACYATLHGDVARRGEALSLLKEAIDLYPDHGRTRLFLGMCSLAALTEDNDLGALGDIDPALSKAYELMPDDHRIPGWIGTVRVAVARLGGDPAKLDAAIEEMIAAADLYPEFNNVSLAIAFMGLPLDSGYPAMAVERLEAIVSCGETNDVCRDNEAAPHNIPGSLMLFGDVYARVGDKAKALSYYELALASESSPTWAFGADAQGFIDQIDARIAAFTDADPDNDPEFFLAGERTCRACHQ